MNRDRRAAPGRASLRDVADTKPQVSAPTGAVPLWGRGGASPLPRRAPTRGAPATASEGVRRISRPRTRSGRW